eukprot:scaffold106986_cov15-Tisochrysis_lutea.AAC.1
MELLVPCFPRHSYGLQNRGNCFDAYIKPVARGAGRNARTKGDGQMSTTTSMLCAPRRVP